MGVYSATVHFPAALERHLFDQQVAAPFDDYVLNAVIFVVGKATNESVHITRFATADPLNNFVTVSRDTETVKELTYAIENGTVTIPHAGSWSLQVHPCTGVHDVHATRQLGVGGWVILHNPYNAREEGENE